MRKRYFFLRLADHGLDYWFATDHNAHPSHLNTKNYIRNGEAAGELKGIACQLEVDEAVEWLTKVRDPQNPFFLMYGFMNPTLLWQLRILWFRSMGNPTIKRQFIREVMRKRTWHCPFAQIGMVGKST